MYMLAEIACFVNRLVSRYYSNTSQIQGTNTGQSPPLKNVTDGAPQKFQNQKRLSYFQEAMALPMSEVGGC